MTAKEDVVRLLLRKMNEKDPEPKAHESKQLNIEEIEKLTQEIKKQASEKKRFG